LQALKELINFYRTENNNFSLELINDIQITESISNDIIEEENKGQAKSLTK